jgi:hypothetical protein
LAVALSTADLLARDALPATPTPRFVFLISDSRSGSTLLARELTARVADIIVTTELNFDPVFARNWGGRSPLLIAKHVASQPNFRVASSSHVQGSPELRHGPEGGAQLFKALIEQWLSGHSGGLRPDCVVIKNGSHARYGSEIHQVLRERVKFIFLVRDPRSVVASKLRTRRPYAPWEVMAWGGSLIAALRWRSYARNMARAKASGADVLEIRYEELIRDPRGVLEALARHCGCTVRDIAQPAATYQVPAPEREIHSMVSEEISSRRVSEWTSALRARDRRIVEAVCGSQMRQRGYTPTTDDHLFKRLLICASAVPQSAWLALIHLIKTFRSRSPANSRNSTKVDSEN